MNILQNLNEQQREAVETLDKPLLILAGAGSGKTRTIIARIVNILEQNKAWASEILALTFTNKAANEMKERIASYNLYDTDHIWMSTFHSACARILRMNAEKLGYTSQYKILDTTDQRSVIRNILNEMNLKPKDYPPAQFLSEISDYKNKGISPKDLMDEGVAWNEELTVKVYSAYEKRLKRYNSMDYDDLILKAIQLFKENPEVLEYYQRKFKYILLDEFQDTNRPQYEFVKMLAEGHRNICVCGDDDQSIVRPYRVA